MAAKAQDTNRIISYFSEIFHTPPNYVHPETKKASTRDIETLTISAHTQYRVPSLADIIDSLQDKKAIVRATSKKRSFFDLGLEGYYSNSNDHLGELSKDMRDIETKMKSIKDKKIQDLRDNLKGTNTEAIRILLSSDGDLDSYLDKKASKLLKKDREYMTLKKSLQEKSGEFRESICTYSGKLIDDPACKIRLDAPRWSNVDGYGPTPNNTKITIKADVTLGLAGSSYEDFKKSPLVVQGFEEGSIADISFYIPNSSDSVLSGIVTKGEDQGHKLEEAGVYVPGAKISLKLKDAFCKAELVVYDPPNIKEETIGDIIEKILG